jgi:hypothetical protein
MIKLSFLAAAATLALVSAYPPPPPGAGPGMGPPPEAYPPCSRTIRDHCIQRNDCESTAVLSADDPDFDDQDDYPAGDYPADARDARGGPYEPPPPGAVRNYPPCSAAVTDSCMQGRHVYRVHRARARAHRIHRAGERG